MENVASEVGMGRDSGVTASGSLGKLWGCWRGWPERGRCAPINIAPVTPAQTLLISPSLGLGRMDGKYDHIESRIIPNASPFVFPFPYVAVHVAIWMRRADGYRIVSLPQLASSNTSMPLEMDQNSIDSGSSRSLFTLTSPLSSFNNALTKVLNCSIYGFKLVFSQS